MITNPTTTAPAPGMSDNTTPRHSRWKLFNLTVDVRIIRPLKTVRCDYRIRRSDFGRKSPTTLVGCHRSDI
jgi:hypothetical protein